MTKTVCASNLFAAKASLFSQDSDSVIVASGSDIFKYNVRTGLISGIVTGDCSSPINKIFLSHRKSDSQIYAVHANGRVSLVDYQNCKVLKIMKVGKGISFCGECDDEGNLFLCLENGILVKFCLRSGKSKDIASMPDGEKILTLNGKILVTKQRKVINVRKLTDCNSLESPDFSFSHKHRIVSAKYRALSEIVVFTDAKGKVFFWDYQRNTNDSIISQCHWHASSISDFVFSSNDYYMYSGGLEGVLVIWKTDSMQQRFLPRLGSPIAHITVSLDDKYLAVTCKNNSVLIVSTASLSVISQIYGLSSDHFGSSTSIVVNPRDNNLVYESSPGILTFFDVQKSRAVTDLNVIGQNLLFSSFAKDHSENLASVKKVSFNSKGSWMATYESEETGPLGRKKLKFWSFDEEKQKFALNTIIENPMASGVKDICFSPDSNAAISIGCDSSQVKVWGMGKDASGKDRWFCSGSRNTLNLDEPFKQVKYSPDGSLICLATRKRLIFLHGESLQVVFVYSPTSQDVIKMMEFSSDCHLCLILRKSIVCVNLISMKVVSTESIEYDTISMFNSKGTTVITWSCYSKDKNISKVASLRVRIESNQEVSLDESIVDADIEGSIKMAHALPGENVMLITRDKISFRSLGTAVVEEEVIEQFGEKSVFHSVFTGENQNTDKFDENSGGDSISEMAVIDRSFTLNQFTDISIFNVPRLFKFYMDQSVKKVEQVEEIDEMQNLIDEKDKLMEESESSALMESEEEMSSKLLQSQITPWFTAEMENFFKSFSQL